MQQLLQIDPLEIDGVVITFQTGKLQHPVNLSFQLIQLFYVHLQIPVCLFSVRYFSKIHQSLMC